MLEQGCLVGAIDGKYIAINSPINSDSLHFNYKGFFSIVLMAICDARYVFTLVDIGSCGSNNDSEVFRNSTLGKGFFENCINLPDPEVISNNCSRKGLHYYLVGDEAFPLQPWLLGPYPEKKHF